MHFLVRVLLVWPVISVAAPAIWSGESGGFKVEWTPTVLKATRAADAKVFVLAGSEPKPAEVSALAAEEDEDNSSTDYRLVSVVGPFAILSTYQIIQLAPGAETAVSEEVRLVRLDAPAKMETLDQLFPPDEILKALVNDKVVQKTLAAARRKPTTFRALNELTEFLAGRDVLGGKKVPAWPPGEGNVYPKPLLAAVSFHSVKDGKVAARIHLPAQNRKFKKPMLLGIELTIPARLGEDFIKAAGNRAGFLSAGKKSVFDVGDAATTGN